MCIWCYNLNIAENSGKLTNLMNVSMIYLLENASYTIIIDIAQCPTTRPLTPYGMWSTADRLAYTIQLLKRFCIIHYMWFTYPTTLYMYN